MMIVFIWNNEGKCIQEIKGRCLTVWNDKNVIASWNDTVNIWKFIVWNICSHYLFPKKIRILIKLIMILSLNSKTLLYQLPKDILFIIFVFFKL